MLPTGINYQFWKFKYICFLSLCQHTLLCALQSKQFQQSEKETSGYIHSFVGKSHYDFFSSSIYI